MDQWIRTGYRLITIFHVMVHKANYTFPVGKVKEKIGQTNQIEKLLKEMS